MDLLTFILLPTPVFFPGESQGWGSLVGCRLWGRTESDTTEVLSSSSSSILLPFLLKQELTGTQDRILIPALLPFPDAMAKN